MIRELYKNGLYAPNNSFTETMEGDFQPNYRMLSENVQKAGAALNNIQKELYCYTLVLEPMLEVAETFQREHEKAVKEVNYLRAAIQEQDQILQAISDRVFQFSDTDDLVIGEDGRTFCRPKASKEEVTKSTESTAGDPAPEQSLEKVNAKTEKKEENVVYNRTLTKMIEQLKQVLKSNAPFLQEKTASLHPYSRSSFHYSGSTADGVGGRGRGPESAGNAGNMRMGRRRKEDLPARRSDPAGLDASDGIPTSFSGSTPHVGNRMPSSTPQMWGSRASPSSSLPQKGESDEAEDVEGGGVPEERFHPCLRVYGDCNFKSSCSYAGYPYKACLSYLKGRCRFGERCHEPHMNYTGPLPLVDSPANKDQQEELSTSNSEQ